MHCAGGVRLSDDVRETRGLKSAEKAQGHSQYSAPPRQTTYATSSTTTTRTRVQRKRSRAPRRKTNTGRGIPGVGRFLFFFFISSTGTNEHDCRSAFLLLRREGSVVDKHNTVVHHDYIYYYRYCITYLYSAQTDRHALEVTTSVRSPVENQWTARPPSPGMSTNRDGKIREFATHPPTRQTRYIAMTRETHVSWKKNLSSRRVISYRR